MARVLVAPDAREDLERLIRTHSLPANTTERVTRSLRPLEKFPLLGRAIDEGRWSGYRFVLGPWRWLIILYRYERDSGTVMVVSFEDARSSAAASSRRR